MSHQTGSHIREVKARATKILGLLRRSLSHCSSKVKEQAYNFLDQELNMPYLRGPPYEKQHIASIKAVRRSVLRFVTGDYSRYSSVTQMREILGWETLERRRHLAAVTTFYKSINNLIYLPIPVSVRPADSRTRSKHSYKFRHIATNTNAYKYSFFPRTIPLWNSLPTTVVPATNPEAFQVHALPIMRTFCHPNQLTHGTLF